MKRFRLISSGWIALLLILSAAVVMAKVTKAFPKNWGEPPKIQTMDYVRLPDGYGHGSSTLAKWISNNLEQHKQAASNAPQDSSQRLYECDFQNTEVGKVPEDFLVLNGIFAVREENGRKFLELPGAPVDDYAILFGPTKQSGVAVTARLYGTRQGRRYPVLAIGVNGLGGYEMQLAPAKRALELFKGDERVASVPCKWESGAWTMMKLQIRQVAEKLWKLEGKIWKSGAPEPASWTLVYEETSAPPAGRAIISGHPYSGTPIWFDDLAVTEVAESL